MHAYAQQLQRRIESACTSRDLDALVSLGQELELVWRDRNPGLYGRFILMLCRALASNALGDPYRQDRLLARFALEAAETPGALAIDARAELLQLLPVPVATGALGEFWADQRARAARLWIDTWLAFVTDRRFRTAMTAFLAHAYALPPAEADELKALLAERAVEDTLAAEILQELDRVRNR